MHKTNRLIKILIFTFAFTIGHANPSLSQENQSPPGKGGTMKATSIYDFKVKKIDGTEISLSEFKGQVLVVVNVASKCGFTNQYEGLEALYKEFKDQKFSVLGFPCNQFGSQEPGTEEEIKTFCKLNYGVTFPMFAKIDVNGKDASPFYEHLKSSQKGILGTEAIKWNFTKFLIDREGQVVKRFAPNDKPEDMVTEIKKLL